MKWHVIYYEDFKGCSEVFDFVEKGRDREKAKILALLAVLEEQGPQLPRPYADFLVDGIHELRIKQRKPSQNSLLFLLSRFYYFDKYFRKDI